MTAFRKKPVEIEAVQMTGTEQSAMKALDFIGDRNLGAVFAVPHKETDEWIVVIETLEGAMSASPGDWIIRGVQGEFYPCKPDIFEATYEPVVQS
jgi:hypothetical protein